MSATLTNGRPRRQLSDQIDRLDALLDGLAEGLDEAITGAAREGARMATREVLAEILSNPDLRAVFARPADPPRPNAWTRLKVRLAEVRRRAATIARPAVEKVVATCRTAGPAVTAAAHALGLGWRFRKVLLVGLGVGLLTAVVSYVAPPTVSAAIGGVGGAVTAVAVRAALRVRALAGTLGLLAL